MTKLLNYTTENFTEKELDFFYSIDVTKTNIRLQGHCNSTVIDELQEKGYKFNYVADGPWLESNNQVNPFFKLTITLTF